MSLTLGIALVLVVALCVLAYFLRSRAAPVEEAQEVEGTVNFTGTVNGRRVEMRGSRILVDGKEWVPSGEAPAPLRGNSITIRAMSGRKAHVVVGNWSIRMDGDSVTVNDLPYEPAP